MTNTFINKVAAEREILRIVNRHTRASKQLVGLSWTAIDAWQHVSAGSDAVVRELKALSDLCQRLSDRSHETFQPLDPVLNDGIASRMEILKKLLQTHG